MAFTVAAATGLCWTSWIRHGDLIPATSTRSRLSTKQGYIFGAAIQGAVPVSYSGQGRRGRNLIDIRLPPDPHRWHCDDRAAAWLRQ